ncbi:FkbM family methyltransferase [Leptothoe sp. PORK10 BA2]|uniref:FkbM family methyltransferase n=1 Tax=Leptothoe sp. PORK10 BA2 TaxID=3110254 RepID=UPI002B2108F8|nr:FkbM family methyltransferase [Leptothoe sp. PORK10 BA2]MEA5462705.1 FkbM family methyltransferase [Leptothoe sp. PORK10 BA2]
MTFISYAQNYEDVILYRALKHISEGFYIDVGANDPELHSVTKSFYDIGWHGVNIEPVASWFQKLEEHRPRDLNLQVAASNSKGTVNFFEVLDTGLSTTNGDSARRYADEMGFKVVEYPVPTISLSEICCNYQLSVVHFLKIDVEGSEIEVLQGIDFTVVRPWIILVEATLPMTQDARHNDWESLISNQDYHFVYFDGLNRFYVANEHQELDSYFKAPPNIWDQFQTAQEHSLTGLVGQQQGAIDTLGAEFKALDTNYKALDAEFKALDTNYKALDAEFKALEKSYQALDIKHQKLEMEITEINASIWWRVALPLRILTQKLKKK